jgi:hypothetical protein
MREIALEVPKVSWDDVGGLQDIKDRLKESVLWPQIHAAELKEMGVSVSTPGIFFRVAKITRKYPRAAMDPSKIFVIRKGLQSNFNEGEGIHA